MNRYFVFSIFAFFTIFLSCSGSSDPKPPTQVTLSLPANNQNCNSGTPISSTQSSVEFSWNEGSGATTYSLNIKNLQTNAEIIRSGITSNTTSVDLNKGFAYEWYVTSVSEDYPDDQPISSKWRFYLKNDGEQNSAPFPAELINPKSGEVIELTAGIFEMQWSGTDPDGDDLIYTLYVDKIDGKQTTPQDFNNIMSTSKQVQLDTNSIYYWRVKSHDSNGNSTYSQIRSFRIE